MSKVVRQRSKIFDSLTDEEVDSLVEFHKSAGFAALFRMVQNRSNIISTNLYKDISIVKGMNEAAKVAIEAGARVSELLVTLTLITEVVKESKLRVVENDTTS